MGREKKSRRRDTGGRKEGGREGGRKSKNIRSIQFVVGQVSASKITECKLLRAERNKGHNCSVRGWRFTGCRSESATYQWNHLSESLKPVIWG